MCVCVCVCVFSITLLARLLAGIVADVSYGVNVYKFRVFVSPFPTSNATPVHCPSTHSGTDVHA